MSRTYRMGAYGDKRMLPNFNEDDDRILWPLEDNAQAAPPAGMGGLRLSSDGDLHLIAPGVAERPLLGNALVNMLNGKTVKVDGTGDYATLQDAVDGMAAGDAVYIMPGTYTLTEDWDFTGMAAGIYYFYFMGSITIDADAYHIDMSTNTGSLIIYFIGLLNQGTTGANFYRSNGTVTTPLINCGDRSGADGLTLRLVDMGQIVNLSGAADTAICWYIGERCICYVSQSNTEVTSGIQNVHFADGVQVAGYLQIQTAGWWRGARAQSSMVVSGLWNAFGYYGIRMLNSGYGSRNLQAYGADLAAIHWNTGAAVTSPTIVGCRIQSYFGSVDALTFTAQYFYQNAINITPTNITLPYEDVSNVILGSLQPDGYPAGNFDNPPYALPQWLGSGHYANGPVLYVVPGTYTRPLRANEYTSFKDAVDALTTDGQVIYVVGDSTAGWVGDIDCDYSVIVYLDVPLLQGTIFDDFNLAAGKLIYFYSLRGFQGSEFKLSIGNFNIADGCSVISNGVSLYKTTVAAGATATFQIKGGGLVNHNEGAGATTNITGIHSDLQFTGSMAPPAGTFVWFGGTVTPITFTSPWTDAKFYHCNFTSLNNVAFELGNFSNTLNRITIGQAWEDLRIPVTAVGTAGLNDPDWVKVTDDGGGSQGVYTYGFSATVEEEIFFNVQLPHGWEEGSDIKPHCHWLPSSTNTGTVRWGMEYTWANIGAAYGNSAIIYAEQAGSGTTNFHQLAEFSDISGTGKTSSSMLIVRFFRDATHANDTYTADALLLEVDFHFIISQIGETSLP